MRTGVVVLIRGVLSIFHIRACRSFLTCATRFLHFPVAQHMVQEGINGSLVHVRAGFVNKFLIPKIVSLMHTARHTFLRLRGCTPNFMGNVSETSTLTFEDSTVLRGLCRPRARTCVCMFRRINLLTSIVRMASGWRKYGRLQDKNNNKWLRRMIIGEHQRSVLVKEKMMLVRTP